MDDIAKAVTKYSEDLVISEDRTKVKRTTPYVNPLDPDNKTIYLVNLVKLHSAYIA